MSSTWDLDFISEGDFRNHVKATLSAYRANLKPASIEEFNRNTIDPIKLILDKTIYGLEWSDIIENEVLRQNDKCNNNSIGYFHQKIFAHINGCAVPSTGVDVIYENKNGIDPGDGSTVSRVYVEMKNKHNTMNSASAARTYLLAQDKILSDDDSAFLLVETIAKESQNIPWSISISGERNSHRLIRRVSIDKFYEMVTGDPDGFYKVCRALNQVVGELELHSTQQESPQDALINELREVGASFDGEIVDALFFLGFSSYQGFPQPEERL